MSLPSAAQRAPVCPVDFSAEGFTPDRLAGYAAIRKAGPVVWYRPTNGFFITGYGDTLALLRDRRLAEPDIFIPWRKLGPKLGRDYSAALEFFDYLPFRWEGRRHAQLRRAMAIGLAPYMNGHPSIPRRVAAALSAARKADGLDVAAEFGNFLFFHIVCDLLGLDEDERAFITPVATMSRLLEWTLPLSYRDDFTRRIGEYVSVVERRAAVAIAAGTPGFFAAAYGALPEDEPDRMRATAILALILLMMGNDAIGGSISFTLADLLPRAERGRTGDGGRIWDGIADEAMRFASPVDLVTRVPLEDIEIAGCRIRKGEALIFSLICANHDPAKFGEWAGAVTPKPNSADGIPFGAGAHLCVGNRLSRAVVAEAFAALARLPPMRISGDITYGPGRVVRTVASLPVQFH